MSFDTFKHNTGAFLKAYAPDIMTFTSIGCDIAAVGFAIYDTPKAIADKKEYDEAVKVIKAAKEAGVTSTGAEYGEKEYRRDIVIQTRNTAIKFVKDYWKTGLCLAASTTLKLAELGIVKKEIATSATIAAGAVASFAQYRENVRAMSGELADREYYLGQKITRVEHKGKDEEGNSIVTIEEKTEPVEGAAPVEIMGCLDKEVEEEIKLGKCPVPAGKFTVKIDEDNPHFRGSGGNPTTMALILKAKLEECNRTMWSRGKIWGTDVLNILGFDEDATNDRFNWNMAHMIGTIDYPVVKDLRTGEIKVTKGFEMIETEEFAKYGDRTHKSISFGDIDFMDIIENGVDPYTKCYGINIHRDDNGKCYFYLDINFDGEVGYYSVSLTPEERMERAWQHPELQK